MKLIGIDIGKNKHFFCVMDQQTGEIISQPVSFSNDKEGFDFLVQKIKSYPKDSILIGMEDTGHYHFALLKYLLDLTFSFFLPQYSAEYKPYSPAPIIILSTIIILTSWYIIIDPYKLQYVFLSNSLFFITHVKLKYTK